MIDFLRGPVVYRDTEYVVLDVNGVGYRIFCANPFGVAPSKDGRDGGEVTMFIHYHVREDAHLLFGFTTREEQSLFRLLLDVSGIGPKVAIGVLAGGRPETIAGAIRQENLSFLTKLPGIGKKTAQRMVLDLKDKLGAITGGLDEGLFAPSEPLSAVPEGQGAWGEAKAALMALGYTEAEADRAGSAIKGKLKGGETADAVTKLALQALFQESMMR
ncbi:Holliday junction branch migration protein RuvA [Paenibacillus mucilaginosus]|uniref:Holliday junction branch migration complex subunit RuvA n=3 Tax=Paenibacillus mucilaginosus TaxID=61624 RepID=H6NQF5_9BACL|nr:Holliday junction branch migration protein RuvA [Paenibacillus mucilaginosus]AEI44938.1 Holliday junction DNA helicase RuvA [Paenibacillus mucilaginosus KNP414]AFC32679.1 Holliday junction DNA helicase RuvA [Paenibacillus mucilaginosus 3016]AFH65011.1 Holliday junction DNA helicase RuvA [Paenibacillus mucilaginosus K02]MCG7213150.1 Holliday junction branch migration protein RuvA [Paenibacillus mucilaginosus]WDM26450.1 Holliday junction branch migration protein RuvA [Paenibacillus mucilagino